MNSTGGGAYGYRAGTGPIQVHHIAPIVLGHVTGNGGEVILSAARNFRVLCGESRVRVKLTLAFVRDTPAASGATPYVRNLNARLYLGEEEDVEGAATGQANVVCNDVIRDSLGVLVHSNGPMRIPEDDGLDGWSQEVVTAADSLFGAFTTAQGTAGSAGPSGTWLIKARFQPDGQRIPAEDWDHTIRNLGLVVLGPEFAI